MSKRLSTDLQSSVRQFIPPYPSGQEQTYWLLAGQSQVPPFRQGKLLHGLTLTTISKEAKKLYEMYQNKFETHNVDRMRATYQKNAPKYVFRVFRRFLN